MALFDQLADRVSAALWNLHPSQAVRLGKHEYDGQVPDLSAAGLAAGYDRLRRLREQLTALSELPPGQEFDRAVLLAALDAEVLAGEGPGGWHQDPGNYLEVLSVDAYLGRDYAPAGLRLERAAAVLAAAGEVLAAARANLEPVLARLPAEWARERARALADRLDNGPAVGRGTADPAGERCLGEAAAAAAVELRSFARWLEEVRLAAAGEAADLSCANLERVLREEELLGSSLEQIGEHARRVLAEDRAALTAAGSPPGGDEAASRAAGDPEEMLAALIGEARCFVVEAGLVSIPDEIALTPTGDPYLPAGRARLDPPGPYDDPSAGAVLYVGRTPDDGYAGTLPDLAVAEGYPGRLLQSRWQAAAPSEVLRRFASRGFQEGWALYAGEAMWGAGYRRGDPRWRRAWLQRALWAGCRLVCLPALHAGEMSVEQAEGFLMEQGCCGPAAAHREAERMAVDPGCLSAALGRLEIAGLRRRWEERFPGASPGAFHDALLSRGAPPLGLLAAVVPM
jgi:hypothetical protein